MNKKQNSVLAHLILIFSVTFTVKNAGAERWIVTTLEWPPFTCSRCPENGAAAKALRDAMKAVDVDVEFVFYSWTQALKKGSGPDVVGVFPAWEDDVGANFTLSESLFRSPVGFVESRQRPLEWKKLSDLKGKVIGITQDYGNTAEFNELIKSGVIRTEVVLDDFTNIRKVALGKLDGAFMDINNARYYVEVVQPQLAGRVHVNPRIIATKDLYLAVNSHNKKRLAKLKEALAKVHFQRAVDDYLVKYLRPK